RKERLRSRIPGISQTSLQVSGNGRGGPGEAFQVPPRPHALSPPCSWVFGSSGYPFTPTARENKYRNLSPTASGPVIVAVAISGYWCAYAARISSTESVELISGSRTPLNSK